MMFRSHPIDLHFNSAAEGSPKNRLEFSLLNYINLGKVMT